MHILQEKFTSFRNAHKLKKRIQKSGISYQDALHMGVIFSVEDIEKHEAVKKFIHYLENDGKKVDVISFLGKDKDNYEFMFDFFTEKNLNFWGNLKADNISKFINQEFDYLFVLDLEPNLYLESVLARTPAKCRVGGFIEGKTDYFEMMVKPTANKFDNLVEELYYYIRAIKESYVA